MRNLAFLIAFLFSLPAIADECESPDAWVKRIAEKNPTITIAKQLPMPPDSIANVVRSYNETPPIGPAITADSALALFGMADGKPLNAALIGIFKPGCRVGSLTVSMQQLMRFGA